MIILEINEFYMEMMEKLKFLRSQKKSNNCRVQEEDEDDLVGEQLSQKTVDKWKDNAEISSQLEKIKDLDEKLVGISTTLKVSFLKIYSSLTKCTLKLSKFGKYPILRLCCC